MATLTSLKQSMFTDYDSTLAPMQRSESNTGFRENFSMMITYAKLTSVDEKSTQFSIVLGMMLMWNDPRLTWNPQQFNNITHLYTTLQQIWFPNFHPCESSSITYLSLENNQAAKIFPNGDVRTILQAEITYSCAFDTARFPFDRQSCLLCFALNGYDPGDVSFKAWIDPPALSADISEWRVQINNETSSFDYCAHDLCMTVLHYSIILSRNPEFWVGLVIIPIFMLGFLILIGLFFSGKENLVNNAINFGLTTMMSMMVVVGILNDSLSKIESIPSMGLFVLIQIAVTSVAVLAALVSDKIHTALWRSARRKNRDASRWWSLCRSITRDEYHLRILLFIIFSTLHIANFVWLMQVRDLPYVVDPYVPRTTTTAPPPPFERASTVASTTTTTLPPIRYEHGRG